MSITTEKTVGQMVAENPEAARIFEQAGIDYCCGGQRGLEEACSQAKMSFAEVAALLEQAAAKRSASDRDWLRASQAELVEHIVSKHHGYVRQELPRLTALIAKVKSVHGQNHPELAPIERHFSDVSNEMTMHMMKEENILFPYIVEMEEAVQGNGPRPISMFGTVQNPVRMMMMEHDSAGANLKAMRELSGDYTPPADGCTSYRVMCEALAAFEADLHQHIHLENNILFPRAIEMEQG
ncbi:MAG: iron-sulfur cluster repair di-iron protein [Candidatus Koribacter versatilis]|uniref:Iron-sulfur cluster repair di-iron protein n=1 Tax=Candidatus Korobacter versatilis TaxID=658062 RepID=A0A932AB88_9BACT|nr:iron-sulfur cluster repair di-iron protein [Candidatus Koribacter versatilis]